MPEATKGNAMRCYGCEYCKGVSANGGFSFYGCYCEPYKGKWVAEIKDCPLDIFRQL